MAADEDVSLSVDERRYYDQVCFKDLMICMYAVMAIKIYESMAYQYELLGILLILLVLMWPPHY